MKSNIVIAALAFGLALPASVQAQGLVRGAQEGADDGRAAGGPIRAIVGGAIGTATGTVNGILGVDDRPRFRTYVRGERRASYAFDGDVRIGTVLPSAGVSYYDVPEEYGARGHRYTVVNGHTVLVERGSGRIVDVID